MITQAGVVYRDRTLRVVPRPRPAQSESGVLIRTSLVGLCGTDRAVAAGEYPCRAGVILGHEFVGVVEQGTRGLPAGTRVVVNPTMWCGECAACQVGRTNLCVDKGSREIGVALDGGLTPLAVVPPAAIEPIPDSISDEQGVMIEPLACMLHAVHRLHTFPKGEDVLIIGGGPVGAVLALLCDRLGARPQIVEIDRWRRDWLARLGIPAARSAPDAAGAAVVADCVGTAFADAVALLRPAGELLLVGCKPQFAASFRPYDLVKQQATVVASCDYDEEDFAAALSLAERLDLTGLISHRVALTDFDRALSLIGLRGAKGYAAMKVTVDPQH